MLSSMPTGAILALKTSQQHSQFITSTVLGAVESHSTRLSHHVNRIDKTNPFIGYFHPSQEELDGLQYHQRFVPTSNNAPKKVLDVFHSLKPSHGMPLTWESDVLEEMPQRLSNGGEVKQPNVPSVSIQSEQAQAHEKLTSEEHSEKELAWQHSPHASLPSTRGYIHDVTTTTHFIRGMHHSRYQQEFQELDVLGSGGQGVVYKVKNRLDGALYAVKKVPIPISACNSKPSAEWWLREVHSMARIPPHPNVIRYHTAWIEEGSTDAAAAAAAASEPTSSFQSSSLVSSSMSSLPDKTSFAINNINDSSSKRCLFTFSSSATSSSKTIDSDLVRNTSSPWKNSSLCDDRSGSFIHATSQLRATTRYLYIQMELLSNHIASDSHDGGGDKRHSLCSLTDWLRQCSSDKNGSSEASFPFRNKEETSHQMALGIFRDIVQGVDHIHASGVLHRDLKPDNILLDGNQTAKVADFGLSKLLPSPAGEALFAMNSSLPIQPQQEDELEKNKHMKNKHTTALGTFLYASPEQLGTSKTCSSTTREWPSLYSESSDIYSLGIILLELCCPFNTMMERAQILGGVRHGALPEHLLKKYPLEMSLVLQMTSAIPEERPSTKDLLHRLSCLLVRKDSHAHLVQRLNADGIVNASVVLGPPMLSFTELEEASSLFKKLKGLLHQLRDRSHVTMQVENLVMQLADKCHLSTT